MGVYADPAVSRDRCDKELRGALARGRATSRLDLIIDANTTCFDKFIPPGIFFSFFFIEKASDNCVKRTASGLNVVDRVSVELEHLGGFRLLLFIAAHGKSVLRYLDEDIIAFLPLLPDAFAPRVQVPGKEEEVIVVDQSPLSKFSDCY